MINRRRLLDAARGILYKPGGTTVQSERPLLRCFPLKLEHIQDAFEAPTPSQFHALLCNKIRQAQSRVLLASLYVGPAASPVSAPKEQDLLDALRSAADKPQVQVDILLDKNRALRPVPLSGDVNAQVTSSAQAVYGALHSQKETQSSNNNNNNLYLFSVLPPSLQYFLPNPYNEVAGVFHIKVYIIDDSLILSGANLSEEYFVDRHDRYLHFTKGAGGLVDFYYQFVQVLCDHSEVYTGEATNTKTSTATERVPTTRNQLLESLNKLLTTDQEENDSNNLLADDTDDNDKTVAVAIPTFQAPESFFSGASRAFPDDIEVTRALLQNVLEQQKQQQNDAKEEAIVRLSSAYLNPTEKMLRLLAEFSHIEFLTAGRTSHGFAPKKKAGNKGKDWIPSVFDSLSREACQHLEAAKLLHYERPGWTFHAKGLWLEETTTATATSNASDNNDNTSIASQSSVVAAICGSGNYGARSETLDMESNCVLILPEKNSSLQKNLQQEWANMLEYTQQPPLQSKLASLVNETEEVNDDESETPPALSWPLQVCLPIIRKFL